MYKIANEIILKVVSRCNLNCSYCHWFRDPNVMKQPKKMTPDTRGQVVERLREYIREREVKDLNIILHGGEPTMLGVKELRKFCGDLKSLEHGSSCRVSLGIQTNGLVVDAEFASFFKEFSIQPGISLDGYEEINDKYRVDFRNKGSFSRIMKAVDSLRDHGIEPGFLAVYQPEADAEKLYDFFAHQLSAKNVDLLVPNFDHLDRRERRVPEIADFYVRFFDLWFENFETSPIRIRFFEHIMKLLAKQVPQRGIWEYMNNVIIQTNGAIEPHDVLRISGNDKVHTGLNVGTHKLTDIETLPLWEQINRESRTLPSACSDCEIRNICRGGYLMHRLDENGYGNPSIYCHDLQRIIWHINDRLTEKIQVSNYA